jgi:multiple sugar transport system permease protein
MSADRNERVTAALFLSPLVAFLGIFVLYPIAATLVSSLFRDVAFMPSRFLLFGNFTSLLADPEFFSSLRFTLLFAAITVPFELLLGLGFALFLNEHLPGRGFFRVCALVPWVIPSIVSARVWELVYNFQYGAANAILMRAGILDAPANWLGTGASAFAALALADTWKTAPFVALILLSGLQAIPEDLYKQAEIDRAGLLRRFGSLTLPLLRPALVVAVLFRTIDALRVFDLAYVITRGGPGGATTPLSLQAYRLYSASDFGRGSAVSVVLFLIALALSIFLIRRGRFAEEVA